jgi:hypothetical protein
MTTRMPRTGKNLRMASSEGVNQVLSADEKLKALGERPRGHHRINDQRIVECSRVREDDRYS